MIDAEIIDFGRAAKRAAMNSTGGIEKWKETALAYCSRLLDMQQVDRQARADYLTFQIILESPEAISAYKALHGDGARPPARVIGLSAGPGALEKLQAYNRKGFGIYCAVNPCKAGGGRRAGDVLKPAVVFADIDNASAIPAFPIPPHILVESSGGKYQALWAVSGLNKITFKHLQEHLVTNFGGDKHAKDLARVLRVPGFHHQKNDAAPFLSRFLNVGEPYNGPIDVNIFMEKFAVPDAPPVPEPYTSGKRSSAAATDAEIDALAGGWQGQVLGGHIPAGSRNASLTAYAGWLRRHGADGAALRAALIEKNSQCCIPPLDAGEIDRIAGSVARYASGRERRLENLELAHGPAAQAHAPWADTPELTDAGNKNHFVLLYSHEVCYVEGLGWLEFGPDHDAENTYNKEWGLSNLHAIGLDVDHLIQPARWKTADAGCVLWRAERMFQKLMRDAAIAGGPDGGENENPALSFYTSCFNKNRMTGFIELLKADSRMRKPAAAFDANPYQINTLSGLFDMRTGELRPCRADDYVTMLAGAPVTAAYKHSRLFWDTLTDIVPDGQHRDFISRLAGYCCVGHAQEQAFYLWASRGNSGKSLLLELFGAALGDYRATLSPASLKPGRQAGAASSDILALMGARLCVVGEFKPDDTVDVGLIKDITGGATISARGAHEKKPVSFRVACKFISATNHTPRFSSIDYGLERRFVKIPFSADIPAEKVDRNRLDKLKKSVFDMSACFFWMLAGAADYIENGLQVPPEIILSSQRALQGVDIVGMFVADELEKCDISQRLTFNAVYNKFCEWSFGRGDKRPMARALVLNALIDRGIIFHKILGGIAQRGEGTAEGWKFVEEKIEEFEF